MCAPNSARSPPHPHSYFIPQTPEFRLVTVLLASPFTLLFCIWGMTSQHGKKLLLGPSADFPKVCEGSEGSSPRFAMLFIFGRGSKRNEKCSRDGSNDVEISARV